MCIRDRDSAAAADDKTLYDQEERRLFYVAMTRAKDSLHIYGKQGIGRDKTPAGLMRELITNPELQPWLRSRPALPSQPELIEIAAADAAHPEGSRLAPADLRRMNAKSGDVLKITGGTIAVARAEVSSESYEGMIQIDGTCRSNCSAGLQEQVTVAPVEHAQAVAVRLSPLWVGAAPATIAPDRMLEDLVDVPVIAGCVVRVPTFAKAVNFQVVRTIPSGPVSYTQLTA